MAKDAMPQAAGQTARSLESGVPSHKAYALSGELPGAGADFGCEPFASMQGRVAPVGSSGGRLPDRARATAPPARNGGGRSQSDADHGPAE